MGLFLWWSIGALAGTQDVIRLDRAMAVPRSKQLLRSSRVVKYCFGKGSIEVHNDGVEKWLVIQRDERIAPALLVVLAAHAGR